MKCKHKDFLPYWFHSRKSDNGGDIITVGEYVCIGCGLTFSADEIFEMRVKEEEKK